jgi:RNAse (barnase) inhibitor barstar
MSQKSPHNVLAPPQQAGIYRLPPGNHAALERAANSLGFARFAVNFDESGKIDAVLAALGRDLEFPVWYGNNLDALNDCLSDFSWREAPGYVIVISGASALHSDAKAFRTLNNVFTSAIEAWQARNVPLWIFYDLSTDRLPALPTLK